MRKIAQFLSGSFLVLVFITSIVFAHFNTTPVSLQFGNYEIGTHPVSVWVIGSFVSGGGIGLMFGLGIFRSLRMRSELRHLRKELDASRKEVKELRASALQDLKR